VVNDTKVMQARLIGRKKPSNSEAEVLLLKRLTHLDKEDDAEQQHWEALVRPGRRLKPGSSVVFEGMAAEILDWGEKESKGQRKIRLSTSRYKSVNEAIQANGSLPLPPYIKTYSGNTELYQTVYAQEQNSAAAPTAGLHFSEELLAQTREKGCGLARVCLEIGLDTFRKVDEEFIADHHMHSERYSLGEEAIRAITNTKERGGRVIAVGTTVVRTLESAADSTGSLHPAEQAQTSLYITPGYDFKVVDALITNFHTPRSTLLMLVAAFCGYDVLMEAYQQALEQQYRFLSFGDAMLIV